VNRAPAIAAALRAAGLHSAARVLQQANTGAQEIAALRMALAAIDGAQQVLQRYARSLRTTRAAVHRAELRALEEALVSQLGTLLRRASSAGMLAQKVQETES
jgi:hypothetical protein